VLPTASGHQVTQKDFRPKSLSDTAH
jgi:hypothetical protein